MPAVIAAAAADTAAAVEATNITRKLFIETNGPLVQKQKSRVINR
jgi:hypothetical protein